MQKINWASILLCGVLVLIAYPVWLHLMQYAYPTYISSTQHVKQTHSVATNLGKGRQWATWPCGETGVGC